MSRINAKNFDKLFERAIKQSEEDKFLRVGQCIFNLFHENYPHLLNEIRGSKYDPFYASKLNDVRIENFKEKLRGLTGFNKEKFTYEQRIKSLEKKLLESNNLLQQRKKYITKCSNFIEELLNSGRVTKEELRIIFKKKNEK